MGFFDFLYGKKYNQEQQLFDDLRKYHQNLEEDRQKLREKLTSVEEASPEILEFILNHMDSGLSAEEILEAIFYGGPDPEKAIMKASLLKRARR